MEKQKILAQVLILMEEELGRARSAANASHEAATADENRPENQFDTRALEASFLARGQAQRVAELEHAIRTLRELPMKSFGNGDAIASGALVTVDCDGATQVHFVLPSGAGLHVPDGKQKISVVTTTSPLGRELIGKIAGDAFVFKHGRSAKEYEILEVR